VKSAESVSRVIEVAVLVDRVKKLYVSKEGEGQVSIYSELHSKTTFSTTKKEIHVSVVLLFHCSIVFINMNE
jgi:hypothetical protein